MGLSNLAIIAIVIVSCLAVVTLGAALFGRYHQEKPVWSYPVEQSQYMRELREKNYDRLLRELHSKA